MSGKARQEVLTADLDETLSQAASLPVLEGDELSGIVSIRDLLLLEALRPSGRPV